MSDTSRVLMISHGHPDFVAGGGELAAYQLHQSLQKHEDFDSVFFARHAQPERTRGGTALSSTGRESEILFYSSMPDWFKFSQPDKAKVWNEFREALEITRPDVVHFHHYLHLGVEMLREVRDFDASLPIVMTLHEFFAICHNHGQMVRTGDQGRCERATPVACAQCFPEFSPQDFYLRERYIKSFFNLVDSFIAPSHFLAERYIEWGLPAEKVSVIDNVQVLERSASHDPIAAIESANHPAVSVDTRQSRRLRCAFFGQINRFKGVDVLLAAVAQLTPDVRDQLAVDLNGSGLERLKSPFRDQLESQLEQLSDCVTMCGPYQRSELRRLMQTADWVVVPSTWWENSPMVIEEARQYGVPVICSDIGGMAEKVDSGVTGLHFSVGDAASLAKVLTYIVTHREQQSGYADRMAQSFVADQAAGSHRDMYRKLLSESSTASILKVA